MDRFFCFSFRNRPPLGFDELQGEPDQTLQLVPDHDGSVEYKVKYVCVAIREGGQEPPISPILSFECGLCLATFTPCLSPYRQTKFTAVQSLLMYFSKNYGGSNTIVYYIGLKGEFSKVRRGTEFTLLFPKVPVLSVVHHLTSHTGPQTWCNHLHI